MVRIIINSDDFGAGPIVNKAVEKAFQTGLISSATTLVNMDISTEEAANMVKENRIPAHGIGIHLNLTSGIPLTPNIQMDPFFCDDNAFHSRIRNRPIFFLNRHHQQLVHDELNAQIEKFIRLFNSVPSHIDSHHHVHNEWAIAPIVIGLASKYRIPSIRIARNCGAGISRPKWIYKSLLNNRIKKNSLFTTDFFGDLIDIKHAGIVEGKTYELMVHVMIENDILIDDDGTDLQQKITQSLGQFTYHLESYHSIRQ